MIHGQYPMNTGCYTNAPMPTDGRQTFMDALSEAGYLTHGIGKCHFSPDRNALKGFRARERQGEGSRSIDEDEYLKYLKTSGMTHLIEPHGVRGEMYYIPQPSQLPAKHHPSQWIGDRSVAFIEGQASSKEQPWYLYSSFIHPHPPFSPPSPWHKLYRGSLMPLPRVPEDWESLLVYVNRVQNRYKYRDQGTDRNLLRVMKAYYYACVSFIDYQVGRIVSALEENGQLDNTLILLSADHGELLGDYNCFGKRSVHDSAARIPMITRLPGVFAAGQSCDRPVSLVDVAPTFLEAAEASIASHDPDGESLVRIAEGSSKREAVFAQLAYERSPVPLAPGCETGQREDPDESRAAASWYMAVTREWKYAYSAPDHKELLFDRVADPGETRNRAGVVFCQEAKAQMKSLLVEHLRSGGETAGISVDEWREFPTRAVSTDPDSGLLVQDVYVPGGSDFIEGYS